MAKEVRVNIDELKRQVEEIAVSLQLPTDIHARRKRERFVDQVTFVWESSVDMNNQIKMKGIDVRISVALTDWYSQHLVTIAAPNKWRVEAKRLIKDTYLQAYPDTVSESYDKVEQQENKEQAFREAVMYYLGLDSLSDLEELEPQIKQGVEYYKKYFAKISRQEMGFMLTSDWESIPGELEDIDHYYLEEIESKNGITLYDKFRK